MRALRLHEHERGAEAFLPHKKTLTALREAAAGCKGCPLWKVGTQTVFGEGLKAAPLVLVGEQPGDEEDRRGRPFEADRDAEMGRFVADLAVARAQLENAA